MAGDTRRIRRRMDFDFPLSGDFAISECSNSHIVWLCPIGTPVRASADGEVIAVADSLIVLKHHEDYISRYNRLIDLAVSNSDKVKTGQIIGHTGRSGLHFSVHDRNGMFLDPLSLLRDITEFHDPVTNVKYYTTKTIVITGDPFVPIYDMLSPQRNVIGSLEKGCVIRIIATVVDENNVSWLQIGHDQWICTKDGIDTIT